MRLFRLFSLFPSPVFFRTRFAALLAGAALACVCANVWSQTALEDAGLLGMSREQLMHRLVDAQPVRSPRRLSSGALGSWRVPDVLCEGLHFEQTLFFANQKLEQIDLVLLPASHGAASANSVVASAAVFAALVQSLRAQLGPDLAASASTPDAVADTASWVHGDADVMLFRSGRPDRPTLRLVIRQRQLVDASEL